MRALVLVGVAACGRIEFDPPINARFQSPTLAVFAHGAGSQQANFDAFLESYAGHPVAISEAAIDATTFTGVDILLVEELNRPYTAAEAANLADWVTQGGSLVAMSGYYTGAADQGFYNSLLGQWVEYKTPEITGTVDGFATHPVTANLTALVYMGGYQLQLAVPGTDIASVQGLTVGVVATVGAGRICIFGDEWISLDEAFDAQAMTFWSNAFTWLRHET